MTIFSTSQQCAQHAKEIDYGGWPAPRNHMSMKQGYEVNATRQQAAEHSSNSYISLFFSFSSSCKQIIRRPKWMNTITTIFKKVSIAPINRDNIVSHLKTTLKCYFYFFLWVHTAYTRTLAHYIRCALWLYIVIEADNRPYQYTSISKSQHLNVRFTYIWYIVDQTYIQISGARLKTKQVSECEEKCFRKKLKTKNDFLRRVDLWISSIHAYYSPPLYQVSYRRLLALLLRHYGVLLYRSSIVHVRSATLRVLNKINFVFTFLRLYTLVCVWHTCRFMLKHWSRLLTANRMAALFHAQLWLKNINWTPKRCQNCDF